MSKRDRLHIMIGKLPYIRKYRIALEAALQLLTPEQKKQWRKAVL